MNGWKNDPGVSCFPVSPHLLPSGVETKVSSSDTPLSSSVTTLFYWNLLNPLTLSNGSLSLWTLTETLGLAGGCFFSSFLSLSWRKEESSFPCQWAIPAICTSSLLLLSWVPRATWWDPLCSWALLWVTLQCTALPCWGLCPGSASTSTPSLASIRVARASTCMPNQWCDISSSDAYLHIVTVFKCPHPRWCHCPNHSTLKGLDLKPSALIATPFPALSPCTVVHSQLTDINSSHSPASPSLSGTSSFNRLSHLTCSTSFSQRLYKPLPCRISHSCLVQSPLRQYMAKCPFLGC